MIKWVILITCILILLEVTEVLRVVREIQMSSRPRVILV